MAKKDFDSLTKKERKELAKKLRQEEGSSDRLRSNMTKIVIFAIAVVIVGAVIFVFTRPVSEKALAGQEIPIQGREHIAQGSTNHAPYNSNPPTSGPHWPTPADCKIYSEEVPDEAAIHSLEHGAVWITYKDKNDKELAANLAKLVGQNPTKVLLSPRVKNDDPIALASWGRLLVLEEFDEQQISDFLANNKNNSPEPLAACGSG
ncbi:MAG: DUF3105 domain-containing protein [Candidatus Woykebacteria bacterium]